MSENKNGSMVGIIVLVLVVVLGIWYFKMYAKPTETAPAVLETVQQITPAVMAKNEVLIKANTFAPELITIKVGDAVTWINNETYGHDVKDDNGLFQSPKLATGEKYSYTYTKVGTFTYICGIHPFMKGSVVVTE